MNSVNMNSKNQKRKLEWGSLEAQIYNKINIKTDAAIGALYNIHEQNNALSFGIRHRHSSNFTLKAKIDTNLDIRAVFDLFVAKNVHLVMTTTYDLVEKHSDARTKLQVRTPFTLRVTFGDIDNFSNLKYFIL